MKDRVFIFPSILSADPSGLAEEIISTIGKDGADGVHIDYMNPPFVPSSTIFNSSLLKSLKQSLFARNFKDLFYDVHIMSNNPDELLEGFANAGADLITVHYEACPNLYQTIEKIKFFGKKAGVALNPETPIAKIKEHIKTIDLLLIMTVNPGWGGQALIESCLYKIQEASELIKRKAPNVLLQVDGGINLDNIKIVAEKGATVFVSGSAIFKHLNRLEIIQAMREKAQQ